MVWKTPDGGKTFVSKPHASAMMFMDASADMVDKKTGGVSGMFSAQFSNDTSEHFFASLAGSAGPCQSIEAVKGTKGGVMGLTGQTMFWNGVALSSDGGAHFTVSEIPAWKGANSTFGARYGAFPSATTWYVTAGSWPENTNATLEGFHAVTERIHLHPTTGEIRIERAGEHGTPSAGPTGYSAGIAKTTDAGKTWTVQYQKEGANEFYFNGIDCADETHCIAVGEADSGTGAGSRIFQTTDGKTWTQVKFNAGAANSLMAARYASTTEAWAAGGTMDSSFNGAFFHSTDGGATYTNEVKQGVYGTSLAFPSTSVGYATAITQMQQSTVCKYA